MTDVATNCRVCGSPRLRGKPFGYNFRGKWLGAVECRSCGVIFLDPQPTEEDFRMMYSKEYFEGDFRCGHEGSYFDDETLERLSDYALLERIRRLRSDGNFLEIGCAGGAFLNTARKSGFNARGVEFSEEAARFARQRFGLDVHAGDLASARYPDASFDVVFMGDVLEHLPDPLSTMKEINRVMSGGGILVICCPMQTNTIFSRLGFALYGVLGKKAAVNLPPYHVFEYRGRSMEHLVRRTGFTVVRRIESTIPPSRISMRNTPVQNMMKKAFQYPNTALTKLYNRWGDRIELYARKGEHQAR